MAGAPWGVSDLSDEYRRELRQRVITPEIARRQTVHGSGLGRARWVVECTFAWLHLPETRSVILMRFLAGAQALGQRAALRLFGYRHRSLRLGSVPPRISQRVYLPI